MKGLFFFFLLAYSLEIFANDETIKSVESRDQARRYQVFTKPMDESHICVYYRLGYSQEDVSRKPWSTVTEFGAIPKEKFTKLLIDKLEEDALAMGPKNERQLRRLKVLLQTSRHLGAAVGLPFAVAGGIIAVPVGLLGEFLNIVLEQGHIPMMTLVGTIAIGTAPVWAVYTLTAEKMQKIVKALDAKIELRLLEAGSLDGQEVKAPISMSLMRLIWRVAESLSKTEPSDISCVRP